VFTELPALRKLSISECLIASLPHRWFLPLVNELRLARNLLTEVPESVILRSVHTLDVSNNQLTALGELRRCKYLQQLSAQGNPFRFSVDVEVEGTAPHHAAAATTSCNWSHVPKAQMMLSRMFPMLRHVDGHPFTAISKEAYLQLKQQEGQTLESNATGSNKKRGRETADSMEEGGELRMAADDAPDVVMEAPPAEERLARVANLVRKERSVAVAAVQRNAMATGKDVLQHLKRQQQTSGW
jgi:hypothetical protein